MIHAPASELTTAPTTVADYFEQTFLPDCRDRGLSLDRINEIRQAIHRLAWWFESKDRMVHPVLTDLTPQTLCDMRRELLGAEIPGRDGKIRRVTPRSLTKSLQALEQIVQMAIEDRTLDQIGIIRIRKCEVPRQIGKLVIGDDHLAAIMSACDSATWPHMTTDRRPIDAPEFWRCAIALYATFGMRTQDLCRYDNRKRPIRWGCVSPPGPSPAEDGIAESDYGWITWVPNKTRSRKAFPMTLPLSPAARYWIDRWQDAVGSPAPDDPMFEMPMTKDSFYAQWSRICKSAAAKPKPKIMFDDQGNPTSTDRDYLIKHLRSTAGTRANDHGCEIDYPDIGRWITGHVSNDVFERHYRSKEKAIMAVIETLPMPPGFAPQSPPASPLRIVG